MNRLYFGDNLGWLRNRKAFPDASVDLVYLDPPFNSNADYNVLFREQSGEVSQAQFHAFTDTWSWADVSSIHRQLPERRRGRDDGSLSQFPEKLTNDGVPRDDGAAPCRAASRLERKR
jgi:adenine specific DNA methylase Mod